MAISAESDSAHSVRFCIRVRMAYITYRTLCIVPDTFFIRKESRFVCLGMSSFYAVIIKMAFNTYRVAALDAVTGFTGFDICPCKCCVQTASGVNSVCSKSCLLVALWHKSRLKVTVIYMTGRAELHWVVAGFAFKASLVRIEPVCVLIIKSMHVGKLLQSRPVRPYTGFLCVIRSIEILRRVFAFVFGYRMAGLAEIIRVAHQTVVASRFVCDFMLV